MIGLLLLILFLLFGRPYVFKKPMRLCHSKSDEDESFLLNMQLIFGMSCMMELTLVPFRGVDPYGTGGTRPPNIWTVGTVL